MSIRGFSELVIVLVALVLSGCASTGSIQRDVLSSATVQDKFTGPWAGVIASTYADAATPAQRDALKDGIISEQEYAYFRREVVECLAGLGVEANWGRDNSLEYTQPPGVSNEEINRCNKNGGLGVLALHDAMVRNPQNMDENEILVACLKRVKAVGPDYTAAMLAAGSGIDKFINTKILELCNADPLNYGQR